MDKLVVKDVGLRVVKDSLYIPHLDLVIVELLPLVVRVHRVAHIVPPVCVDSNVLHHGEQAVLWSGVSALTILIENAEAEGGSDD